MTIWGRRRAGWSAGVGLHNVSFKREVCGRTWSASERSPTPGKWRRHSNRATLDCWHVNVEYALSAALPQSFPDTEVDDSNPKGRTACLLHGGDGKSRGACLWAELQKGGASR